MIAQSDTSDPIVLATPTTIALSISHAFHNKQSLDGTDKPKGYGWPTVHWTLDQLVTHITTGKAICVAQVRDGRRIKKNFLSAQLMGVDLDNGPDLDTLWRDDFIALHAAFGHYTPSSSLEKPRCRVYFILDAPIRDWKHYEKLQQRLLKELKRRGFVVDEACKDAGRLFYGSTQPNYRVEPDRVLPLSVLEALPEPVGEKRKTKQKAKSRKTAESFSPSTTDLPLEQVWILQEKIRSALRYIPKQQDYLMWLRILMAVFWVFPDQRGVDLIEAWSPGKEGEVAEKFRSFDRSVPDPVTIGTLWREARRHGWRPNRRVKPDVVVNVQFMTQAALKLIGACIIKSAMGTGKTHLIKGWIEQLEAELGRSLRVLVLAHRVSLIQTLAGRLGFESYDNLHGVDLSHPDKLICTPNSIHKLYSHSKKLPHYDVVILDESEQQLAHLVGETLHGNEGIIADSIIRNLIQRATYVLAMDAHASELTVDYLKSIREDVTFIENRYQPKKGTLHMLGSYEGLRTELYQHIEGGAGPVVVACDERQEVEALMAFFQTECGDVKLCGIHSGNSQDAATQAVIKNINAELQNLHLLIFSPSLGTGVDIQTQVSAVFGVFHGRTLTPEELHQLLGRCRHAGKTYVYLKPIRHNLETSSEVLYQQAYQNIVETGGQCDFDPEGNLVVATAQKNFLRLTSAVNASRNTSFNLLYSRFIVLARKNYAIRFCTQPFVNEELCEAMEDRAREQFQYERQKLLEIEPVDAETYQKYAQTGQLTPEMRAGYERWCIEDFYGERINEWLIEEWDGGKGKGKLERFIDLYQPRSVMVTRDQQEEKNRDAWGRRSHDTLRWMVLHDLLGCVFSEGLHTRQISEKDLKVILDGPFAAGLKQYGRELHTLFGRRRKQTREPLAILRHLLCGIGLKLETKYIGKKRRKFYKLCEDRYKTMLWLAKSRLARTGEDVDVTQSPFTDAKKEGGT